MENDFCTANVYGDYYVKVYGFGGDYSNINYYRIRSGFSAVCTLNGYDGAPSKSTYLCNEDIVINGMHFDNSDWLNSYTNFKERHDLFSPDPGNDLYMTSAYSGSLGWLGSQTINMTYVMPASSNIR